ncbi:MAG TPA: hypothetical protein PLH72_13370 [Vicinamibacterales bacterium]|nr:hypothetical protein [Vicinamibacterales bacterium]
MKIVTIALMCLPSMAAGSAISWQAGGAPPNPQIAIASQLVSNDPVQQSRALLAVETMDQSTLGDDVKAALATALQQESRRNTRRYWQNRAGQALEPLPDPELMAHLSRVVAELHDPRTIPALAESLGVGSPAIRTLAGFGELAAPAVLDVVMSPASTHYAIDQGLIALRFMVEASRTGHRLSPSILERIGHAAEYHLTHRPRFIFTVWRAIDLAVTLQDPRLRTIVQAFASGPQPATAMGATDSDDLERTQKKALDGLAGVPPLPRP